MGARRPMAAMTWISDLAGMKAAGTIVIQTGCRCGFYGEVDLDHMIGLLGVDGSLWDRRPPCPLCGQLQHFMAAPGRGTAMRPLLSVQPDPECLPPQAWMAGWTGRR